MLWLKSIQRARSLGLLQSSCSQYLIMASPVTASTLRLMTDLRAIQHDPPEGCSASPASEENMYVWSASIMGPEETPWVSEFAALPRQMPAEDTLMTYMRSQEGGIFSLRITFSDRCGRVHAAQGASAAYGPTMAE